MRQVLPQRRTAETFDLRFWNQLFTVTVGFYADGTPGEVFIDGCKTGNDIESIARDAGVLLSLALQHGVDVETIAPRNHARRLGGSGVDPRRDCRRHCKDISEGRPMNICATTTPPRGWVVVHGGAAENRQSADAAAGDRDSGRAGPGGEVMSVEILEITELEPSSKRFAGKRILHNNDILPFSGEALWYQQVARIPATPRRCSTICPRPASETSS